MFKLESYLTPLLLNYVDKYIKNLKPEDSQFSLWGGDAVFCNLDLRLDVLEQELQLPFTFVNGHIHELRIHIPWTKLGSEPVIITINTIECILKLSTENEDADSDRKKKKKFAASRGLKKPDISEAPPGYVQSLINRVISNICIICNNVVLKYVEDDIVLSLNIKSVELFSANEKWEKVFLDTNLAETVSRKVIYMQDLTVCLDKRDASGKIETYQDPLLYRCSSTWRMYSVYKSPHSKYPSLTRIHMFCENLDFSLTDQQLPMFLRLLNLCIALHNGSNFTSQENKKNQEDCSETRLLSSEDELDDSEVLSQDASWGSWAWSFVPDVGVLWNSSSTEEELEESNMLKSKKIFQFGVYIGKSSCVLKHTMISQESSCCSSPKYAFSPLMIIKMYGCSMEFTSKGKDFINVQSGVCGVTVTGLEDCVCSYQDFSTSSNEKRNIFLKSGVPPGSGHAYSFLSSSLFDPLAPENCNQERKYCFNSVEHLSTLTEEVLIQRFPAFAFDYLYELEVPEDWIDKISSITSSFLEDSNWHESATCRLVFGPLCVDVTSSLIHRLQKLMVSAQDYDYPYYSLSRKTSVHSVSVDEDILTQMEEFVPVRQYHLTLFKPVLRLSVADHFPYLGSKTDSKKMKKRSSKFSKTIKSPKAFETLFSLEIYADCLDFQTSIPMYPNKLIKVIGCLSNPNQFLLHHCYNSNSMKVFGLEILLHEENSNIFPENTIVQQNCLTFFKKSLVQPEKWSSTEELTLQECTFECSNMHLKLSELEFLALISIYQSWTAKFFNLNGLEKLKIASKESQSCLPVVCAEIYGINALYMQKEDLTFMKFSMISLCLKFQNEEHSSTLFHAPESTANLHNGIDSNNTIVDNLFYEENKHMFLEILLQKPNDMSSENLALLVLNVSGSTVCLEPAFFDWLSTALFTHLNLDATDITFDSCSSPLDFEDTSTCSSLTQEASASYSLSKSHSTVLVSTKKVSLHQNIENFLFKHCHFLSYLVLEIEIGTLCCIIPQSTWSVKYSEGFSVLHSWQHAESNEKLVGTCVFCLPNIKIKNNNFVSNFLQKVEFTQIIDPFKISQCDKRNVNCFPWTLQVDSCSVYSVEGSGNSKYNFLLCPTTVSATLALSLKNNQNQIALCIHIDSKSVQFNMSAIQAELLVYCFNTVSVVVKFTERLKSWLSFFQLKVSDVTEYLGLNAELNPIDTSINYKKASDNDHCKKTSSNEIKSIFVEDSKPNQKLTLWIQMTLSKLSVVVLGKLSSSCNHDNFKIQFDAEEIVSSYDFQEVYSKMIMKLSSLSVNCFVKPSKTGLWRPGPYEGKVVFCSDMISRNVKPKTTISTNNVGQLSHMKPDNQPFLVATYTQALHSNVKEKLSANAKQAKIAFEEMKYISEIDLKIKSFGVILWMSLIDVLYQISRPFLDTFTINPVVANSLQEKECLIGLNFCAKNLPLFYIESNIIQVYLPENTTLTKDVLKENGQNIQDENEKADVLLLQLDYVILTSQVENPLPRIILDSDIYTSALNSKTISLPGAAVEDRQYQMDVCGLTLGSISGTNIVFQNEMKKDIVSHYPLTMGENPALEWNTGIIPENRSFTKDSAVVTPIISPLNIRVAIAPAIVCDVPSKESEKILVAGISSEISVTSEVCLFLNIHQTCIMYSLFKNNLDFVSAIFDGVSYISENCAERSSTPVKCNKNSQIHNFYASSVISSDSSNVQVKLNTSNEINKHNFVPFEVLITAGTVSVMLFYHEIDCKSFKNDAVYTQNLKDISVAESTLCNNSLEYHTKEIKFSSDLEDKQNKFSSTQNVTLIPLHPFLCLTITQPHSYLLCHPSSQKFESSCFDLQLHGSPADFIVERPHKSCSPLNDDFTYPYLETKPGEPHEKTGIPPAFLTVTCTDIFSGQANIKISVERPVKLNFRTSMGEAILTFMQCFQEKFRSLNTSFGCEFSSNARENSSNMKILTYFTNMTICTSQIMLELSPLLADNSEKLIISAGNMKIETDVEACKDDIKCLDLNLNVSSFMLQILNSGQLWNVLKPLTFSTVLKCHLKPCLQIELCTLGESLLLNISVYHVLIMKGLIEAIFMHIERNLENLHKIFHSEDKFDCVTSNIDNKKRMYWNDDLRKGAFQFIQADESQEYQPKAHEIVFSRSSANEPASMTWRYPEPRALTKIEVSPVPLQCNDEGSKKVITCYLQYWNSTYQEYVNFHDFVLSETEQFNLNLPDLNSDSVAVSTKWRVLLDCGSYIDDDGVLEKENPYLSPLALAACMSIDSCFDPNLVPVFQTTTSFELVKIILYNIFEKSDCSPKLYPFEFDDESPLIQEFSVLSFISPSFKSLKYGSKFKGELSSGVIWEILEYRNLTMLPVISPVDILTTATVNHDEENVPIFDMEIVLNPCFIRINQSIIHTLTYTMHSISQEFYTSSLKTSCSEYMLPNYYIICNNLEERIRFGQAGTEENIILSPLKMHAYSWWCHKNKQVLWISVGSLCWKWSEEFSIDTEGMLIVQLDHNISAIIRIKQLSNFQKRVIIDGQFKIHSQLSYPIQIRCEFPAFVPEESKVTNLLLTKSLAPRRSSPAFLLSAEQCKSMRLSITGILDSQIWSESICVGGNILLEIPFETAGKYQSVWCQVLEREISSMSNYIAVFISPLFTLRSNLPMPVTVQVSSEDQEEMYELELIGQGQESNLFKSSNKQNRLELNFLSKTDIKISVPSFSISSSDLNQVLLKPFDKQECLHDYCFNMQPVNHKLWPYSFLERPLHSQIYLDALYPCSDKHCDIVPAIASNISCKLKINLSQRWPGLNTILYDLKPQVILLNRLRTDLFLFNENGMEWMLPPNSIAIPSKPHESFRLSILEQGDFFYSSNLTVEENCTEESLTARNDMDIASFFCNTAQKIPQNGSINVLIKMKITKQKVFLFKLHSEVQEDIIVVTAFPVIMLSCEAKTELLFSLSCAAENDKNLSSWSNPAAVFRNTIDICHPLLVWQTTSDIISSETSVVLDYYISISIPSSGVWSYPIHFHSHLDENNRHSVSVPVIYDEKVSTTIPFVITSHRRNGMLFLIINTDPCPLLLLHNRTSVNIFYGQSLNTDGKVDSKSVFEEFQKHAMVPVVSPGSSVHYSFPLLQKQFPCVPDKLSLLCFGLKEESSQNILWSIPFKINVDKQFVHILGVCDFMVCSERIGHTINLFIDPVNRIEVTANEVRSRIALATNAADMEVNSEKKESGQSRELDNKKKNEIKMKNKSFPTTVKRHKNFTHSSVALSHIYFINIRIIHVSLVLCDEFQERNKSIEVLRLNIDNIILHSRPQNDVNYKLQEISLCFEHVQLDNQLNEEGNTVYDFPVVLHRHISKEDQSKSDVHYNALPNKIRENSMFILNAVIELPNEEYKSIVVQSVNVELLPISLMLEDVFYYKVMNLFKTYIPMNFHQHEQQWCDIYIPKDTRYISSILMHPVHFQHITFNIQEISLSVHASLKLYLSLEHSLLRFQPFERKEIFTSHYEMGRMIVIHYVTGALFRAGWVVGSLDLLGNPAGFARAVSAGMSDFVYLPYKGLLHGPRAFVSGLTNGAISLFTQISSGAITCMASLASSISKNMDFLCLDGEHLARQELVRRHLPEGISDGLTQGLSAFGLSVLGAVAGLVDHPLQVLVSPSTPLKTATGVVGGLGKGIVGVFTKPIGGAAELLSQAGYGLLHGAGWLNPPKRRYQPVTVSLEMVSSSVVKYVCKVALCQSFGDVLLSVEAMYVNEKEEYEKNILLLTSEALCILNEDEVTLQRTFALTEIKCKKSDNDQSTLVIIPCCVYRKQLFLESGDALDRVAEYVKKSREEISNDSGNPSISQDNVSESLKSSSTCHVFILYPKDRNLFLTLFNYAKSKALHKGF